MSKLLKRAMEKDSPELVRRALVADKRSLNRPLRDGFVPTIHAAQRGAAKAVAAQVALEAGNSPQMIFERYRELVTEKAAKSWFAVTPETAEALKAKLDKEREAKIVKFPMKAAA